MKTAANSVVTELTGTPSAIGVYTFGTWAPATNTATATQPAGNLALHATSVATTDEAAVVQRRINGLTLPTAPSGQTSAGYTNWQQGLLQTTQSRTGIKYDAVLFITDGVPTANGGPLTGTAVSVSPTPTAATPRAADLNAGIDAANTLKTQATPGTRVIAVGVTGATTSTLQQISGPTQNSDWFLTSFGGLGAALKAAAAETCEGTVTVVKEVQAVDGSRSPAANWEFGATASGATVTPGTGLTGDDGAVNFAVSDSAGVNVTETQQDGFRLLPQNGQNAVCTRDSAPTTSTNGPPGTFSVHVGINDIVSCTVVNEQIPATLTLVKVVHNISGNAQPQDWVLHATGPTPLSGTSGSSPVTAANVVPGTYSLSESGGPTPPPSYTASDWVCTGTGVTQPTANTVTLAEDAVGTCTITNTEVPVVQLVQNKTVDQAIAVTGDTLTYTMTVRNVGTGPSGAFTATDTLPPAGVAFVSATPSVGTFDSSTGVWTIPAPGLAVNASATLTITATVTAAPAAGTSELLTNRFEVTAPPGSGPTEVQNPCPDNSAQSCADTEVFGPEPSPQLVLSKTVDSSTANPGDTLVYTVQVLNSGNTTETNFTAADVLPSGVTFVSATPSVGTYDAASGVWTIPSLAPGDHATLMITVTVNSTGTEATVQTNRVTLTPPPGVPVEVDPETECTPPEDATACADTEIPGVPRLAQDKSVDATTAVAGDQLTYTMTVTNNGTAAAENVVALDILPPDVSLVSLDTHGAGTATEAGGLVTWNIGTIPVDATVTLTVVVTVEPQAEGTTLVNRFHVQQPPGGGEDVTVGSPCDDNPDESCASTDVPGVPRLTQGKVVDASEAPVGATLTYTVTVTNNGTGAAENALGHDELPAGVTFVSATASQGAFDSATGVWTIGTLAPEQTVTLTIVVTINPGTEGTTLVNRFLVDQPPGGPPPVVEQPCVDQPDASCAATDVPGVPRLTLGKTVDHATAVVGDTLTYTITITNTGTGDAGSVIAHDTLPAGVTLLSYDTGGQGSFDPSTGIWTVPVPAGATVTLTLVVRIDPEAAGTTLVNRVSVTSPPGAEPPTVNDPCPDDPTQSCATTVVPAEFPPPPPPSEEGVHPGGIPTDLGPSTGYLSAGGAFWRSAWVLPGGLLALLGIIGLTLAVPRLRRAYRASQRRGRWASMAVASLVVLIAGFVTATGGGLVSGKVPASADHSTTSASPSRAGVSGIVSRQAAEGRSETLITGAQVARSPSNPTLIIPAIGLRAAIVPEGIDQTSGNAGNLSIPMAADQVGWWNGGPAPGQGGVAVIAGHRVHDWAFDRLPDLRAGDAIQVIGRNGQTTDWTVSKLQQVPKTSLPTSLWTKGGPRLLALVTCDGTFNYSTGHFDDNIIVWAAPVND